MFNVKDFGATGNGVTDDTVAIQNAINATTNVCPRVYFPHGRYRVSPQGTNDYALKVPAPFTPNGSLGTIIIEGDGGSSLLLGQSVPQYNIGTTIVMASTANKPVFRVVGGRSIQFRDLNIQGTGSTISGSIGVSIYDYNSDVQFHAVGFNGFQSGVNIGDPGLPDGGSHNNDLITFRNCKFTSLVNAITNYGFNAYGVFDYNSYFNPNVENAYKYFPDPAGSFTTNQSIHFIGSQISVSGSIIWSAGAGKGRLGVAEIRSCTIEPGNVDGFLRIHRQDDVWPGLANALIIRDNEINMNSTSDVTLTTAAIEYGGRGPFIFEGNRVDSHHFEIFVYTDVNMINGGALTICNNQWLTRPIIRYPLSQAYPPIVSYGNYWSLLPKRNLTDPAVPTIDVNAAMTVAGVGMYAFFPGISPDPAATRRAGSIILNSAGTQRVSASGTYGTLTGVTGSINSGSNVLTLTGGASSERAWIVNGTFIRITGVAGAHEVDKIYGDTVTLRTNAGATVVNAAVQFNAPTVV